MILHQGHMYKRCVISLIIIVMCGVLLCLYNNLHTLRKEGALVEDNQKKSMHGQHLHLQQTQLQSLKSTRVQTKMKHNRQKNISPEQKQKKHRPKLHLSQVHENKILRGQNHVGTRMNEHSQMMEFEETPSTVAGSKMQWRTKHLAEACRALRHDETHQFKNFSLKFLNRAKLPTVIVVDRFKLLNCKIAKVGSSNIAKTMHTLEYLTETNNNASEQPGKISQHMEIGSSSLNAEQFAELQSKFNTYIKFMFVRDPLERAISAFRDKKPVLSFKKGGKFYGRNVTFPEYLMAAILNKTGGLNKHIAPYYTKCLPCHVSYDFAGQIDNFNEDMNVILEQVGAKDLVILPKRNTTGYMEKHSAEVFDYYKNNTPKYILKEFYKKFYIDFFLFGYPRPF